jgi:hypothetical protein
MKSDAHNFKADDCRFNYEFAVIAAISSLLSSKIGFNATDLKLPAMGFKNLDTTIAISLIAKY